MTYSKDFLLKLDKQINKTTFAKVTALKFDESPIESIEGRITQGSINIDGASAVRRTCSLTMVANDFRYDDFYWGLNTKFKLEIGVRNTVDKNYPDIVWFPQGVFILTSLNTSRATNNFTIQLQGKDKMCLLNGEVGGSLESSVDFGTIEEEDVNGVWTIRQLPIYDIIRNMVHQYAGEPYHNIVINDLNDYGLELLEYRYDTPMYLYRSATDDDGIYGGADGSSNILMDETTRCAVCKWNSAHTAVSLDRTTYTDDDGNTFPMQLRYLQPEDLDLLIDTLTGSPTPKPIVFFNERVNGVDKYFMNEPWYIAKIEYGQAAGYRQTELTYAGDLIANVGESLTSVLDKIKNMLSEFEYFYDLDGRFVFQRKQAFVNTLWTPINEDQNGDKYIESLATSSSYSYIFNGGELITAFNNNPNLLNLRNDYSIWGQRTGVSGAKIPVHMRYAIDNKPEYYKSCDWGEKDIEGNDKRPSVIYVSNESVYEKIKDQIRAELLANIKSRVTSYTPKYGLVLDGLETPVRQPDGSYSKGWWDIRDWYEYYYALKQEYPNGTMKFYSHNNEEGMVKVSDLPGKEISQVNNNQYCWIIIVKPDKSIYLSHGTGNLSTYGRWCDFYDHAIDPETGAIADKPHLVTPKAGYFTPPYSGCTDTHTYRYFMQTYVEKGEMVYFYNPSFPAAASLDDAIEQQVEEEFKKLHIELLDWRELIYQMARDFYHYNDDTRPEKDYFELMLIQNNGDWYPTGRTDYEQYYIDIQGFWRQLYNPYIEDEIRRKQIQVDNKEAEVEAQQALVSEDAEATLAATLQILQGELEVLQNELEDLQEDFDDNYYQATDGERAYWNKQIYSAPETLNFWFDFLDTEGELQQFNVKNIGARPKSINDTSVKSIYFRETPGVIFRDAGESETIDGYKYIQIPDIEDMFTISAQGKSAKDRLDELIYQHSYCIESATITSIPIYYLQPNTRIHLFDQDTGLNGDYVISKLTIPLAYNGTMSITATKAAESII